MFSKGCSNNGRLVAVSAVASLAVMLVNGIGTDLYSDTKTVMMFWLVLGLISCIRDTERGSSIDISMDIGTTAADDVSVGK